MTDRAAPYVLAAGQSRRDDAILPFRALANDTGGLLSAREFTLGPWESGPVLHQHTEVDEAFYVVAGKLEAQLDDWPWPLPAGSRSCSPSRGLPVVGPGAARSQRAR